MEKIKRATNDSVHAAFDTIGTADAQRLSVESLAAGGPGKVISLIPVADEVKKLRDDVEVGCTYLRLNLKAQAV